MAGLHVAPDKKAAYTDRRPTACTAISAASSGPSTWATTTWVKTAEVPCRSRFSFGMSTDGKKLYIYGAGFEIEVYDAVTLKYERTWDLNNDTTMAGMIVLP